MHRALVICIMLSFLSAGCSATGPFGNTVAGGQVATQSVLLGVPLPSGMEYYPSHSSISGLEGVEVLRGNAGPALCTSTIANGLMAQGWSVLLSKVNGLTSCHLFENGNRLVAIHVTPQNPMLTIVEIYAGNKLPAGSTVTLTAPRTAPGTTSQRNTSFSLTPSQNSYYGNGSQKVQVRDL